jgi:hypothetical protein
MDGQTDDKDHMVLGKIKMIFYSNSFPLILRRACEGFNA